MNEEEKITVRVSSFIVELLQLDDDRWSAAYELSWVSNRRYAYLTGTERALQRVQEECESRDLGGWDEEASARRKARGVAEKIRTLLAARAARRSAESAGGEL